MAVERGAPENELLHLATRALCGKT
jgi:hypothetical protein